MALRHEELTSVIIASLFEVHNHVGVGLDEELYHQSLLDCFLKKVIEDYSEIKGKIGESMRQLLAKVRDAILFVYETHGLGYGTVVCRDLIRAELDYQKISYQRNLLIQVEFQGTPIRACKAKALCIAEQILVKENQNAHYHIAEDRQR